jgi:Tfp pilus assembly pilus retraction ATPase PilT
MTMTRRLGSFTLEDSLAQLVKAGLVEQPEAMARAAHPDELEQLLRA